MTLATYTGHEPLTFPDYLDLGTGRTLTAEPGETYDITPASGRLVPDIPQGWFTPVRAAPAKAAAKPAKPAETGADDAAEPNGEPE